jgi:hypothetical protein
MAGSAQVGRWNGINIRPGGPEDSRRVGPAATVSRRKGGQKRPPGRQPSVGRGLRDTPWGRRPHPWMGEWRPPFYDDQAGGGLLVESRCNRHYFARSGFLLPSVLTRPNRVGNEQYRARWAGGGEGEVPAHRRIDQPAPIGVILDRPQPDAADSRPGRSGDSRTSAGDYKGVRPDVLALSGKFSCATQNDLANSSHPRSRGPTSSPAHPPAVVARTGRVRIRAGA